MKNKLIIISGGMDSVTLLHKEEQNIKLAISFYYGQKHKKELIFAEKNCKKLNIPWKLIDLFHIYPHLKSNLLDGGGEIPEGYYEDESMKQTVVPFRNGIMLSIAVGIAESNDCHVVLIGAHAGDHTIYPDCREGFIHAFNYVSIAGTYKGIQVQAPFIRNDKRHIAVLGRQLGVDFKKTWTCYKGKDLHCGKCGACIERKEAMDGFDETKYED